MKAKGLKRPSASVMSTSSADSSQERPLAEAIAVATRSVHAKLNKLIIARLPQALPPRSSDPSAYISGLLHIAPIYITFESLWQNILDGPSVPDFDPDTRPSNDGHSSDSKGTRALDPLVCTRIHSLLGRLRLPGLMRSGRLRADIRDLTGWPEHLVEEQLKSVSNMGRLGDFIQHIKRSVEHRPHVLLAYSYIMYMALFAGGRFIRAALESVGTEFWDQVPSPIKPGLQTCQSDDARPSEPASGLDEKDIPKDDFNLHGSHTLPLRFFHFPTPMDGEDLKREFKGLIVDSEKSLTARERHDVIKEAVCIFDNMMLLVQQLDTVCAADSDEKAGDLEFTDHDVASFFKNPIRARLRDSIFVAKQRSARSSRATSSSEDSNGCSQVRRARTSQEPSSRDPTNDHIPQDHPQFVNLADTPLCPASRSMRFQKTPPRPPHGRNHQTDGAGSLANNVRVAVHKVHGVHVINWLIIFGIGAVVLGALVSARRSSY